MVLLISNNCMTIHIVVCYINLIFRCQNIKIKIDVTELLIEKKSQILRKEKSHQGVQWQAPLTDCHIYPKPDSHVLRNF